MEDMDIDDYTRDRSRSPVRDRNRNEGRGSRDDYRSGGGSRDYKRPAPGGGGDHSAPLNRNYENLVFVRNVPFTSTTQDINELFQTIGEIAHADIVTRRGQSRGMATVEFKNKGDAQRAIEKLDNYQYGGRELKLRQDYPPPEKNGGRHRDDHSENRGGRREERDYGRDRGDLYRDRPVRRERGAPSFADRPGIEIFVGNLPFSITWQSLKDLMRKAGEVIRADVRTDNWGKLRGFGTVIFESEEDANRAVDMYSGYSLDGRQLDVRLGRNQDTRRDQSERSGDRSEAFGGRGGKQNTAFTKGVSANGPKGNTIFVDNLPWVTNEDDLFELFETIGKVVKAEVHYDDRGRPSGGAVVEFELDDLAELAIQNLNGYNYGGRALRISYARRPDTAVNNEPVFVTEPAPVFESEPVPETETAAPIDEDPQYTAPVSNEAELPDAAPEADNGNAAEVPADEPVAPLGP